MTKANWPYLTIGDVARHFGCSAWQIRRLFERGLLPPAQRIGTYRVVPAADLPRVAEVLRQAGYLPDESEVAHVK